MSDAKNIIKDDMEMISMPINPPPPQRNNFVLFGIIQFWDGPFLMTGEEGEGGGSPPGTTAGHCLRSVSRDVNKSTLAEGGVALQK